MNELNLVEILKNCPKGTKLYSPLFGEVEFESIDLSLYAMGQSNTVRANSGQPIVVRVGSCHYEYFTADGRYDVEINQQECMLFPSKDVRTWDNFKPKKPKFDPKTLNPFDRVIARNDIYTEWRCELFSHTIYAPEYSFRCIYSTYKCCIPYNDDTKHLVGTYDDAPEHYRYWED